MDWQIYLYHKIEMLYTRHIFAMYMNAQ